MITVRLIGTVMPSRKVPRKPSRGLCAIASSSAVWFGFARAVEDLLPLLGQRELARGAIEQCHPQLLSELCDCVAHC